MDIDKIVHKISLLHSTSIETPTSFKLAEEIIDRIPVDWNDPDLKILDPGCGRGTFLLALIKKLERHGHSRIHIIRNMIHGADISKVQFMIAVKALKMAEPDGALMALISGHLEQVNSLTKEWNMKFDVVVGNPPFQESKEDGERKDQASNLWSKFWAKGIRITKPDGVVALITPTSWLSPSADLKGKDKINNHDRLWDVFNDYSSSANITDVSKHFPGVGSSFGYVIVDKSGNSGLSFTDGSPTTLGFLPKSNFQTVVIQLDKTNNLGSKFLINQDNTPDLRVSVPMTRKLEADSIEILNGISKPTKGSDKESLYMYIHVNTPQEAVMVQQRIINCLEILNVDCRWSGFINGQTVRLIKC